MFIQIIEWHASDKDAITELEREWEKATDTRHTVRRSIVAGDRDDKTRFMSIVFFDSYESAMENSNLPETDELSRRMRALVDDVTFHDLDVIDDRAFDTAAKGAMT